MSKRQGINLLAGAIVLAGGLSLSAARPAQAAATLNPCTDLTTAVNEASDECFASGGKSFRWSGSCTSSGYTLSTVCTY